MTNYPIKIVLKKLELSGRTAKWAIALSSFDIRYQPRTAIKSQALADFVADFSPDIEPLAQQETLEVNQVKGTHIWKLFVDGSS